MISFLYFYIKDEQFSTNKKILEQISSRFGITVRFIDMENSNLIEKLRIDVPHTLCFCVNRVIIERIVDFSREDIVSLIEQFS